MVLLGIVEWAVALMSSWGYFGLFVLMVMESMIFPIPSEAVMPFAGFLVADGQFSFFIAALVSGIASIVGSLLSYYIGEHGGRRFLHRFGKYFLIEEHHIEWTERWFEEKGEKTILIGRLIPVVRHIISIFAGIGRMSMKHFLIYTLLGALIWNTFLLYIGFLLREKWDTLLKYSTEVDIIAIILLVGFIVWFVWKHRKIKCL
ncbi:MAG TPA: DedA family protein [Candidatus Nanoarchaeia archaeon]|nr:DedA family protein [Candidatus Nanoarchaeia archaeon]